MEILLSSMYKLHFNSEAANAGKKHWLSCLELALTQEVARRKEGKHSANKNEPYTVSA